MRTHLVYPRLIPRHRYLGTWSRADVLIQLSFVTANVFCVAFRAASLREAGVRAASLSLTNLIPAFTGPHLSSLADILGVSLCTFRRIHRSAGIMSLSLLAFHIATVLANRTPFSLRVAENMWGLVGASSLCLLLLLCIPVLRRPSYEVFLRLHQALAALSIVSIWRHLLPRTFLTRLSIYVPMLTFASILFLQSAFYAYQNKAMGAAFSRAYILHHGDEIMIRVEPSRRVRIKAGQYIELWIPAVGLLQSHPFTVATWSEEKTGHFDLLVERRAGFTQKLLESSKASKNILRVRSGHQNEKQEVVLDGMESHHVFFSGPHGISVPVGKYETVLMIASDFGIASQLPYLSQLIYGYNACKAHIRRIHLVWQVQGEGVLGSHLLNAALWNDVLDQGYILSVSIYILPGLAYVKNTTSARLTFYNGKTPDLESILDEERSGTYINRVQKEAGKLQEMAVLVSATSLIRDQVKHLVRNRGREKMTLHELAYQPS
ncbi:hypothetical protein T440DRAFT_436369 [Plenodomus tracheiphilus IPT5]|uniref:ferric-chelate reductase (NADPH) n=1 Tax=Plenodomus tracheiphilus IPT5 TaxID=1408161 RepID=A0A6A7AP23_9PLEO|nr:hypothetical protein T440DRAFT_436369 [Plenodomus tracheiphilus IPT5]